MTKRKTADPDRDDGLTSTFNLYGFPFPHVLDLCKYAFRFASVRDRERRERFICHLMAMEFSFAAT